ncbi:MAG: sigma-70 family RNA polymerase sigma factor [Candidatus Dadabacteria bacterium]|nr:sigma-70 family RNA polymerase sigma factor [Candidatus Dadabacteria bacterium]NIQ16059.1 sigma-70 family RNA polymerase sigma factor [Candidatus Dadabacteria bacterium]
MKTLALNSPLNVFLKNVNEYPILTKDEEYDLAVKYHENKDLTAANKLVVSNLKFVIKIATEYKSYNFPLMDLVQEGVMGLMHAIKKFNPYRGYRLLSYAVWWIRAGIHNHIMKFWSNVKIGTTQAQRKLFHKIEGAKRKLGLNNKELNENDIKKIAEHFGVEKNEIIEMEMRMASRDFSLDSSSTEDGSVTYLDMVSDSSVNQEDLIADNQTKKIEIDSMKDGFKKLNERELKIINERYLSDKPKKLKEIGDELGISRERVRQIESKALMRLNKHVNMKLRAN